MVAYRRDLDTSQWWPRDRILQLQQDRLHRLLQHAYDNVPYFRCVFDERGLRPADIKSPADLSRLPVLTKPLIRQNYDSLRASGITGISTTTSGSTGEPLAFLSTAADQYSRGYARTFRARSWSGWRLGDRTLEFRLRFAPENIFQKSYNGIKRYLENIRQFSPQEISDESLSYIARRLDTFRPEFIFGYPSSVYLLGRYLENHPLVHNNIKAVMTDGEQIFDTQRELFRKVFNCDTFSYYSTWEVFDIAAECPRHTGHHIAAEDIIVEIADASGNPVPAGTTGRILLTNLHNYAMPFIRYDVGDTASLSEAPCPCGRSGLPLLVDLNGRADIVIRTRNGKQIPGRALPAQFLANLGISQYQIIQESYEELCFNLVFNNGKLPEKPDLITREIEVRYRPILGSDVTLKVNFVTEIPPDKSGKRNIIISKLQ